MRFESKHLHVAIERDWYRHQRYRSFLLYIGRRKQCQLGEIQWRLMIQVNPFPRRVWLPLIEIYTIPAWSDVPSVAAEYRLTMRPYQWRAI